MKPYRNAKSVEIEVEAAAAWYEQQRSGLGAEFLVSLEHAMIAICSSPRAAPRWPDLLDLDLRRYMMARFPFLIGYRDLPTEVVVLAVAHAKRAPLYWLERARTRSPIAVRAFRRLHEDEVCPRPV